MMVVSEVNTTETDIDKETQNDSLLPDGLEAKADRSRVKTHLLQAQV